MKYSAFKGETNMRLSALLPTALLIVIFSLSGCKSSIQKSFSDSYQSMKNFVSIDNEKKEEKEENNNGGENTPVATNNALSSDCPKVEIVDELHTIREYTDNTNPSPAGMLSYATLQIGDKNCSYNAQFTVVER